MIRALALEDFETATARLDRVATDTPAPAARSEREDAALAAFDEGYRDGWDDCARAEAENHRRIAADLAANLQNLADGYEAARADVLANLAPLFEGLAAQLLPALAAEAVAPAVLDELQAAAESCSSGRAVLVAAPSALPALERLVDAHPGGLTLELRGEPAYAEGQVSLRFDGERRDIDLGEAASRMAEALRAFVADQSAGPVTTPGQNQGAA